MRSLIGVRARRSPLFIAIAAAVLLVGAGSAAASAATPVSFDAINPASIVITNTSGADSVTQWSTVRIDAAWSVPDTAVAGDTFTLQLPPELSGTASAFDLPVTDDPTKSVAHCVISDGNAAAVLCTLTDYVVGRSSVSGAIWFTATATTVTSATTVAFTLHGATVAVALPGGGIGTPPQYPTSPLPTSAYKSGWQQGSSSLGWQVVIPGASLTGVQSATVSDTITPASATTQEHHNTDGVLVLQYRTSASDEWFDLAGWTGGWNASGTAFSMTLAGPFAADRAYRVLYSTTPTAAYAGDVYANVADVSGVKLSAANTWTAVGGGVGSGLSLVQFAIAKTVGGNATNLPSGLVYAVEYSYGAAQPELLSLEAGGAEVYSARVAAGSSFTIREVDIPTVTGFAWATPRFSGEGVIDNGDGTATVTPTAGQVVHVTLANTAVAVTTPPTGPSAEPTSSASPSPSPSTSSTPTATSDLASTGGELPLWLPIAAFGMLVAGALAFTVKARRRRS